MLQKKWFSILSIVIVLVLALGTNVSPVQAQEPVYVSYIVQSKDSLAKIAFEYCSDWQEIYDLNRDTIGKDPNVIEIGMVLLVPAYCGEAVQLPEGIIIDSGPIARATGRFNPPYYTIAWGDNLYSIGVRFGLDWREIASANEIEDSLIYANRVLYIPNSVFGLEPPDDEGVIERVNFQQGANSASLIGAISQGVPKSYILWAQKGQTINVKTNSHGEALVIQIGNVRGDLLPLVGTNSQIRNNVSVVFPEAGDFIVTIRPRVGPENPRLEFDVTFTIN